ncbi:MAG TPA: hypothetical protein VIL55_14175 [Naasia sp.]|jgi:hypothetical protein
MDLETKPAAFKRGVPKAQLNGLFGLEEHLMANDADEVVCIVRYRVEDVISKEKKGERYPVVETVHIEPLRDPEEIGAALKLLRAAYSSRTGEAQLDLGEIA